MSIFKTKPSPAAEPSKAVAALDQAKAVVETMAAKQEAANRHSENLAAERARVALAAHTGDEAARKRLDEINAEISVHGSEVASIAAAIAQARENVKAAEDSIAAEKRTQQQADAKRISGLILAESERFDRAAAEMADALHRRQGLHLELAKTGVIASAQHNQLRRPMAVNRALARAGVAEFGEIDRGGSSALAVSLADHDAGILGRPDSPAKAA